MAAFFEAYHVNRQNNQMDQLVFSSQFMARPLIRLMA